MRNIRERYRLAASLNPRLKGWRAYANWLLAYLELRVGAEKIRARPLKLIFDPTNACQLKCPLCPTGNGSIDRRKGLADVHLFRQMLDQVGPFVFMIDFFNWGDPLLNPRLVEYIQIASHHNILSTVCSNFSLQLSDEQIHRILTSGVNEIIFSIDGASKESHERYRRKSDFGVILENARRVVQARRELGQNHPRITWQFVIFRFNEQEVEEARRLARELGFDRIVFNPPFIHLDRFDLSKKERMELEGWVPSDPAFHAHMDRGRRSRRCGWHYTAAAINWDGAVTPCSASFKLSDDLGTIKKNELMEILNNPSFRAARAHISRGRLAEGIICSKCPSPSVMGYQKLVYRRILGITLVGLFEHFRGWLRNASLEMVGSE